MIERLSQQLEDCQSKSQLENFLRQLCKQKIQTMQDLCDLYPKDYLAFALLLREKILDLVLQKGDIGESFYLISYLVFAPLEERDLERDVRLQGFLQTAQACFLSQGLSEIENLMLLELEVLCLILDFKTKQAIKRYIQGISHLEMHLELMGKASEFIRACFPAMGITMDLFLESITELLEPTYYIGLPILRTRSILNWQLHCFWNVPNFFNHRAWLKLFPFWKELFYHYLCSSKKEELDHALYFQFFIYHMCGNSYATQREWRDFCEQIDQPACERYKRFAQEIGLQEEFPKPKREKKLIAILRDRIVENSPYKVELSFLKQLLKSPDFIQHYEIRIYLMNLLEKSQNSPEAMKSYEELGIKIIDGGQGHNERGFYNSHLDKALGLYRKMQQDGVEILISPNNGYGISDFLLSIRSAPRQIFWSHGNFVYDIPQIDARMTHICSNSPSITHEGYSFIGVPVVMDESFYNPPIPHEIIAKERSKYPQDKQILGTIGRLTKIDSLPYLKMLIALMQEFPDTIYLACGSGNIQEIEQKLESLLGEEYRAFRERFYFCGYVNSAIYGHIIDLWLDSFPMEQGESRIEYVAKGKLSLVLAKTLVPKEWKNMANTEEEYMQKARILLSLSPQEKQELIQEIMEGLGRYNHQKERLGIENFIRIIQA